MAAFCNSISEKIRLVVLPITYANVLKMYIAFAQLICITGRQAAAFLLERQGNWSSLPLAG